jgi:hypothetical protein
MGTGAANDNGSLELLLLLLLASDMVELVLVVFLVVVFHLFEPGTKKT